MLKSLFPSTADPGSGEFSREELIEIAGRMPEELRPAVATYLRTAPIFLAWMELTDDLVKGSFRVPGGSSVISDGTYYWRLDTANYVEHYGIEVPAAFLEHVRTRNWEPGDVDDVKFLETYEELEHIMKTSGAADEDQPNLQTFYPQ